jgi:penicillin-binding protein activator
VRKIAILMLALIAAFACSSHKQVSRLQTDQVTDLSGQWNDTDAKLVAQEMVSDCLAKIWLTDFLTAKGQKPVVTVGTIRNMSSEHIDTDVFSTDFERELINSGKIKFVAGRDQRGEIRNERADQQENSSDETMKKFGKEIGADFILLGSVKTITDEIEGRRTIFYQTDFELVNLETNEKVWIGSKEIKKGISQGKVKW